MDLLHWRAIRTLTHRETRRGLQLLMLLAAATVVVHGLTGPQLAPRNLATVLTWVHYRGVLILVLVAVGNLFCTACPMMLLRDAGRRIIHPRLPWPRFLRRKWLAIALLAGVLFACELLDLWSQPRATALLIIGYMAAALVIDLLFSGATFCKYVCPIGQFNFVAATMSPLTLRVRDEGTCRRCQSVDCIKGRRAPATAPEPARLVARGCELGLFLPAKVGNLDCTMCFDCVRACPHDNIGLMTRVPGAELASGARLAGIGRLQSRADLAMLVIVCTFGALLNAFAMTGAATGLQRWMVDAGLPGDGTALAVIFVAGLVLVPLATMTAAAAASRALSSDGVARPHGLPGSGGAGLRDVCVRYAFALAPLGTGIWLAHYGFHLLTGALTFIPVTQSAVADMFGRALMGEPLWGWTGLRPGLVFPLQFGCVLLGTLGSAALISLIARRTHDAPARAAAPWHVVIAVLAVLAVWTLALPMDMRGMVMPG